MPRRRPKSGPHRSFQRSLDNIKCGSVVLAEYSPATGITILFEYQHYLNDKRLNLIHPHPACPKTRERVRSRVAVNKRLLFKPDSDDYYYKPRPRNNEEDVKVI